MLPEIDVPNALEAKFDLQLIKPAKYKLFQEAYPEIGFEFAASVRRSKILPLIYL